MRVALAGATLLALGSGMQGQEPAGPVQGFLEQQMGLSAADMAAVRRGTPVVALPAATDPRDIAAFAVVRVNASRRVFVDAVLGIEDYMRGDAVSQVGRFSAPPVLADLDGFTLSEGDLGALRDCRPGQCGLKLSAAMIATLRAEVPWSAPDWRQQAVQRFKQVLVDYVASYRRDGPAALAEYVDKGLAVKLSDETQSLMAASPYVAQQAPEFVAYLALGPAAAPLPGTTRLLFWATEQFGYKPTLTISEVVLYLPPSPPDAPVFMATTQLYATHYFEASVALTVATALAGTPPPAGFHLLYLHRSRLDGLRGGFLGLKRFAAGRRIRARLEHTMQQSKANIERLAPYDRP